jgi:hypothetical protein
VRTLIDTCKHTRAYTHTHNNPTTPSWMTSWPRSCPLLRETSRRSPTTPPASEPQGTFRELSGNFRGTFGGLSEDFQETFRALSRNFQGTFRALSGNFQGTFRELSGHFQGTFRALSGNFQGTFRALSRNFQGTFRELLGHFQGTFGVLSGNLQGSFRELSVIFTPWHLDNGTSREHSGNIQGAFREHSGHISLEMRRLTHMCEECMHVYTHTRTHTDAFKHTSVHTQTCANSTHLPCFSLFSQGLEVDRCSESQAALHSLWSIPPPPFPPKRLNTIVRTNLHT